METIKSYGFGALVFSGWIAVAAYVVFQVASMPSLPVVRGPEVVIWIGTRVAQAQPSASGQHR